MLYRKQVTDRLILATLIVVIVWLFFVFTATEVKTEDESTEMLDPGLGIITIIFFVAMGILVYLRSKFMNFSSFWKYSEDNKKVAYVLLGLYMIKMDRDNLKRQHYFLIQILSKRFDQENLREIIADYYNSVIELDEILKWFLTNGESKEAIDLLDFLTDLAFYNEVINRKEISFLLHIGKQLKIEQQTIKSIIGIRENQRRERQRRQKKQTNSNRVKGKNYYRNKYLSIFGLSSQANFSDVKKAYRKLAKELHPDRFHRKTEAEQNAAHERFTGINIAYDKLKEMME